MSDRIPVTLLTGFLGAGKTTILNRILKDPSAGRIAVVVNEFGDAGLDHDLIEETAEDVVLMAAGCLCCSIRGDLSKTLQSLRSRKVAGDLEFDRVVIETTGLADPGPVHHTLLIESALAAHFSFDGIVTAVDSVHGVGTLARHAEAQTQVAMADVLILTKSDLADQSQKHALTTKLDQLNPRAKRIAAKHGTAPSVSALLGLRSIEGADTQTKALDWLSISTPPQADPLAGISGFSLTKTAPTPDFFQPSHHATDNRITSASITIDTPIPASVFDFWLDTLVALKGENILRLKGVVHIEGVASPFVFHGVQHIMEPPQPLTNWPEGDTISRVVVIARDVPLSDLEQSLALLEMRPEEDTSVEGVMAHTLGIETP